MNLCAFLKMGHHKNHRQEKILLQFMADNSDIAKGFTKRDKFAIESLWHNVTKNLNSEGPPQKDVSGWKKVWLDWKNQVRKKLRHNKKEERKTGGGPNNMLPITEIENDIAVLCGIFTIVDGVEECDTFGVDTEVETTAANIPSSSNSIPTQISASTTNVNATTIELTTVTPTTTPNATTSSSRRKRTNLLHETTNVQQYFNVQKDAIREISGNLKELVGVCNENNSYLKRTYRAIENLHEDVKEFNKENKRHNLEMEKMIADKTVIKQKILEIEKMKLQIINNNNL